MTTHDAFNPARFAFATTHDDFNAQSFDEITAHDAFESKPGAVGIKCFISGTTQRAFAAAHKTVAATRIDSSIKSVAAKVPCSTKATSPCLEI